MGFDARKHHRRSIRLQGYDYSQTGAYFVMVCTKDRICLFGDISDGCMRLNDWGRMVEDAWFDLPNHYANVRLGAFVVMPNHMHGIVIIVGAGLKPAPTTGRTPSAHMGRMPALPEIVRGFKTFSARRINERRRTPGVALWQRNYYEHIVRDEAELNRIQEYIETNPACWAEDTENPNGKKK